MASRRCRATTSPSTTNTLGTKGVGEAGTIASTPAVVNAIVDAVRSATEPTTHHTTTRTGRRLTGWA